MHSVSLRLAYQRTAVHLAIVPQALQSTQVADRASTTATEKCWDEPQYPPIVDLSPIAKRQRKREALYEKIRNVYSVEEKQIALNMSRYYGFRSVKFCEDMVPYGAIDLVQHYTRTHFVQEAGLPDVYKETEAEAALLAKEIRGQVEEALSMEYHNVEHITKYSKERPRVQQVEDAVTRVVIRQLNRIITNSLAERLPHVLSSQVDYDPRHEAFWVVGGTEPTKNLKYKRKSTPWSLDKPNDPMNKTVHYTGKPLLALRMNLPLRPLVPYSEAGNPNLKVPKFRYHEQTLGYSAEHKHGCNIPGFWTGDQDEFGLLSIHGRGHLLARTESYGEKDNLQALDCQAMKVSFGWLLAQASYQGFTTYNDITYPLITQTAITNGQLWSLYAYQLNTIKFHDEHVDRNPKRNICYGTGPIKLFEEVDSSGNVVGFNEDVLKQILQLYMNAPEVRDYDMKPYLHENIKHLADQPHDLRRNWLENKYKHIVSNRPRHLLPPEVYMWEKIYKIRFETRFQEARRRFFELDIDPFKRRLDEHVPKYIPKVLRPYPRHGRHFEKTFYPKV